MKPVLIGVLAALAIYGADQLFWSGRDVDPLAWLANVLARIAGIPQGRLHELLPWAWKCAGSNPAAAQAA